MSFTQTQWLSQFGKPINIHEFWFNPTNQFSMRLSKKGWVHICHNLNLVDYKFLLKEKISPRNLLQLERHIKFPYYVQTLRQIHVFDETTALMLTLNANNLQKYLNDLENNS